MQESPQQQTPTEQALACHSADAQLVLTQKQIVDRVRLVQDVMKSVMRAGTHYGTIPGCGDQPVLLKAGAEKLAQAFRLAPEFQFMRHDLPNGHVEFECVCAMRHMTTGEFIGQGIGSCSTMESKYRYRRAREDGRNTGREVPGEYWAAKRAGRRGEMLDAIGGTRFFPKKVDGRWMIFERTGEGERVENPDIADCWNTVRKMAKKRALVDATLTCTAASDIFEQDDDDLPGAHGHDAPRPGPGQSPEPTPSFDHLDNALATQLVAICRQQFGMTGDDDDILAGFGRRAEKIGRRFDDDFLREQLAHAERQAREQQENAQSEDGGDDELDAAERRDRTNASSEALWR